MTTTELPPRQHLVSRLGEEDLELMLLIREFEKALLELFSQGLLSGTTHTCLGQEYIPVALRTLLGDDDFVFSNHRGHGHYLARFGDPVGLLAEIMGREGAVCNGVGGSQHILRDRYLSTGVQGESMLVATGAALRLSRDEPGRLSAVYIGDGTWGEGAVYEALNIASLWRLPLLVVVENNGIAQSTPTHLQMAGSIAGRAAAFGVRHARSDSTDVTEIRRRFGPLVAHVRNRSEPVILEFITNRLGPHSKGDDTRSPELIAAARHADWYCRYQLEHAEQLCQVEARQRDRVAAIVRDVIQRPLTTWKGAPCREPNA